MRPTETSTADWHKRPVSLTALLDGIRDLSELIELDVSDHREKDDSGEVDGVFKIV